MFSERLLQAKPEAGDAYFGPGMENYLLSLRPGREQRTPGCGGVEGVGGQGEEDNQHEDGCARVPCGEIRESERPQSVPFDFSDC